MTLLHSQVINELNNIPVTREKVQCLHKREWLNDEVINFFIELIKRHNLSHAGLPRVFCFNT